MLFRFIKKNVLMFQNKLNEIINVIHVQLKMCIALKKKERKYRKKIKTFPLQKI